VPRAMDRIARKSLHVRVALLAAALIELAKS